MDWFVYIIHCSDDSFYTGITTDLDRRFSQHACAKGAKYFRARQPLKIVYQESGHCRSSASKREIVIKKLSRNEKMQLMGAATNEA